MGDLAVGLAVLVGVAFGSTIAVCRRRIERRRWERENRAAYVEVDGRVYRARHGLE